MPIINSRPPAFNKRRDLVAEWDTFRQGLNLLLRPTELKRSEYPIGDNIMLKGSGVVTGRWGTSKYFTVNATGSIRGFATYSEEDGTVNELIGLSDQGFLAKRNGTSSTRINGISYPSGSRIDAEQLGGYTYIVSKDAPMVAYNGATLSVFATLSAPASLSATNVSGVSGTYSYSWKVTTLSVNGGETTASQYVLLNNLPQTLSSTSVRINWTQISAASGMVRGYNIYRGLLGDETWLAGVGASISTYLDNGSPASETILTPKSNTTGGVKSNFIEKFNDRLLVVPQNDPTLLMISGRYPDQSKFNWTDGGGAIYIDPDSGSPITGIAVQPGTDKILVYKGFAHYLVTLSNVTLGNYVLLDASYQPVSTSNGASNDLTITTVENDTFYFGRNGIYVTGYEPNFLNIIRTNEISARIRPYLALLNDDDYETDCAAYINQKYLLSFPNRREIVVYDRERGSFAGIWKLPFGISKMLKYIDITGTEKWVIGSSESNQVYIFNPALNTDDGTAIAKAFRTNKEQFDIWSQLKIIKFFYTLFTNITGEVNVNILLEDRNGATSTVKTFTISGAAVAGNLGWGIDAWGTAKWGSSNGEVVITSDEIYKWGQLFKTGRLVQIEVTSTSANSNFELLNLRMTGSIVGGGTLSSQSRV